MVKVRLMTANTGAPSNASKESIGASPCLDALDVCCIRV